MPGMLDTAFQGALLKIDFFSAFVAFVGFVKLIGKNLFVSVALGTFAGKGF